MLLLLAVAVAFPLPIFMVTPPLSSSSSSSSSCFFLGFASLLNTKTLIQEGDGDKEIKGQY